MYLLIIVSLVLACLIIYHRDRIIIDMAGEVFFCFTLYIIASLGISIFLSPLIHWASPKSQTKEEFNIISIKDSSSINGSFVLGTGRINSSRHYITYIIKDDGGIYQQTLPVSETLMYESERFISTGKLIKFGIKSKWGNFILIRIANNHSYQLLIPKKTITRNFSL